VFCVAWPTNSNQNNTWAVASSGEGGVHHESSNVAHDLVIYEYANHSTPPVVAVKHAASEHGVPVDSSENSVRSVDMLADFLGALYPAQLQSDNATVMRSLSVGAVSETTSTSTYGFNDTTAELARLSSGASKTSRVSSVV